MGRMVPLGTDVLGGHGDFSIDADPYWTLDTNCSIAGGVYTANDTVIRNTLKAGVLVAGTLYAVTYTITAFTGTGFRIKLGTVNCATRTATGTYYEEVYCGVALQVFLNSFANTNVTVDNLTVVPIMYAGGSRLGTSIAGNMKL